MRHIEAFCNGVALTAAVPRAIISQVHEDTAETDLTTGDRPGSYGQRIIGIHRKTLHVGIEFVIRELYDLAARSRAVEAAAAWAQDGILELSSHPGRRLRVFCTTRPAVMAARDYTAVIRADFTAIAVPFWEDSVPRSVQMTGTSGSSELINLGSAPAEVEATVKPSTSGNLTCSLTVGGTSISFSAVTGITSSAPLRLWYDENNYLHIDNGSVSKLAYRTAASADDMIAQPGINSVSFTASRSCTVTFAVRGRYL